MTTDPDTALVLRDEILAEARRQGEEIVSRAKQDAEASLAAAAAEADMVGRERLDQAHAEAARRSETILATVSVETGRLQAERIETLLESVHVEARHRLSAREGLEYREALITLASYAISRMTGEAFVLRISETDRSFLGEGLAGDIARRTGRQAEAIAVSYEPDFTGGGVVVENAEGRQMWDNRLEKRLDRMWPELRRRIAAKASFVPKTESGEDGP